MNLRGLNNSSIAGEYSPATLLYSDYLPGLAPTLSGEDGKLNISPGYCSLPPAMLSSLSYSKSSSALQSESSVSDFSEALD